MATTQGIRVSRIWSDDDMLEFAIDVSTAVSHFANRLYVGHDQFAETVAKLDAFKTHIHGGLLEVRFGEFGCEYAGGAFHARLHFATPRRFLITCHLESEFEEFGSQRVASRATFYLRSEPTLLDRFIDELREIAGGTQGEAWLETV